eukprot:3511914-Pleurochrysis_carterae.AAC.1
MLTCALHCASSSAAMRAHVQEHVWASVRIFRPNVSGSARGAQVALKRVTGSQVATLVFPLGRATLAGVELRIAAAQSVSPCMHFTPCVDLSPHPPASICLTAPSTFYPSVLLRVRRFSLALPPPP